MTTTRQTHSNSNHSPSTSAHRLDDVLDANELGEPEEAWLDKLRTDNAPR